MLLSRTPRKLYLHRAVLINAQSGFSLDLPIKQVVSIDRPYNETGYFVNFRAVEFLNNTNNANFLDAPMIVVRLWYGDEDRTELNSEVFQIRREMVWRWIALRCEHACCSAYSLGG